MYNKEMPQRLFLSWIGNNDIGTNEDTAIGGPIVEAVHEYSTEIDRLVLLSNYDDPEKMSSVDTYIQRLDTSFPDIAIDFRHCPFPDPTNYDEITATIKQLFADLDEQFGRKAHMSIGVSSGTPAMQAVWVLLSQTIRFPSSRLISSQKNKEGQNSVREVNLPFKFSADVVYRQQEELLRQRAEALGPAAKSFNEIRRKSPEMEHCIREVQRLAPLDEPILLEGETGTGKRLFAQAIHEEHTRARPGTTGPLLTVNCAALPGELLESELFGYEQGAFTGATSRKIGLWEQAKDGTLFLDEIGELSLHLQAKLLTALQDNKIRRVGGLVEIDVKSTRVVVATNMPLRKAIRDNKFREDLFQRLSVGACKIPSLRERTGDADYFIDLFLKQANKRFSKEMPNYCAKVLSPTARNRLLQHNWPGNVRELENTIRGLAIRIPAERIEIGDVERVLDLGYAQDTGLLNKAIGAGFKLSDETGRLERHYVERALKESENNRTKAAALLGLPNYQMLHRMMDRLGLRGTYPTVRSQRKP